MEIKTPAAKQNKAKPISESLSCNFSFTCGIYKTQVPIIKFKELNTQTGAKYLRLDKINLSECIK
ncbi:hypothetical protein GCM10023330_25580 [Litoribaculum gwangyangense]|uniref:Uncharacterized protein n=1 Tax=Litoribaculum gwangyangense TaxID=1130722 RepID=A0ABP9CWX5_9FLAO